MAYEILGETIKSATSIKLGQIFGSNTIRYKESVVNVKYPHFFISQPSLEITPAGKTRLKLDYLINIRYRIASDVSTVTNVQQQLDAIGTKLCYELLDLPLELPTKTRNRYYEKDDGVLQFFFNITVFAEPQKTEEDKFKKLKIIEEVL